MSIRRCFQFRLRTLLAGMTVLCVALVVRRHVQRAQQLDAMLQRCDLEFVAVEVDGAKAHVTALQAIYAAAVGHEFHLRRYVSGGRYCGNYYFDGVTDDDLSLLPASASLRRLELPYSKLTEMGFAQLRRFPNLRVLQLDGCENSPTANGLAAFTELTELRIIGSPIDRGALAPLHNMPRLAILELSPVNFSDPLDSLFRLHHDDIESIGDARNLEQLDVRSDLSDADIQCFARLTRLKRLTLSHNRLTGVALRTIGKLTALEKLDLGRVADVKDELQHLSSLRYLRSLSLEGHRWNRAASPRWRNCPA